MPFDAFTIRKFAKDCTERLAECRVDKIAQPERWEVVLTLRGRHETVRLLISANANHPRVQYLTEPRKNPDVPPNFCMLLRKHLLGGRFLGAETTEYPERLLSLRFQVCDEMGDISVKTLHCEALGRAANIILCDAEGRILDCLHRIEPDEGALRPLMPGLFYRYPPLPDRRDPTRITDAELREMIAGANPSGRIDKWFSSTFFGLTPVYTRELAHTACGDTTAAFSALDADGIDRLVFAFRRMMEAFAADKTEGCILRDRSTGKLMDYAVVPIRQYGLGAITRDYGDIGELLSEFYAGRDRAERMERRGGSLLKIITAADAKLAKKLSLQEEEYAAAEDRERLLRCGDTLNAYLYMIPRGAESVTLPDPYSEEGAEVTIRLDPRLSPAHNAQKYYKEYAKKKNAAKILAGIIDEGRRERAYLETVLDALARAETDTDLDAVSEELTETGYIKRKASRRKEKSVKLPPLQYRTTAGLRVFVGRSNIQNDQLSLHTAGRFDLWLHTQKSPGAHCILECEGEKPDNASITEACMIAAWHSKARQGAQVPVDYTLVKNLKKPAGAKPGFVIYHVYETAYVTPDEAAVRALEIKETVR